MKISRRVIIEVPVSFSSWDDSVRDKIAEQLMVKGFNNIESNTDAITGIRGQWWQVLTGGDPRKLYQTISIRQSVVIFNISTWWQLFANADDQVIKTEVAEIEAFVLNGSIDIDLMKRLRRKGDHRGCWRYSHRPTMAQERSLDYRASVQAQRRGEFCISRRVEAVEF
jgi:hypothetical protein